MFGILRIAVGVIIGLILLLLLHKHKKGNALFFSLVIIFVVALITVAGFIPFENVIYTFKSPEAAYKYYLFGEESVDMIVNGNNSAFVVGTKDNTFNCLIVPKVKNGWKLGIGSETKIISRYISNKVTVIVYKHKHTNDYYISVSGVNGLSFDILDSVNSEFYLLENPNSTLNKEHKTYYAYISNYNKEYNITVDGYIIELGQINGTYLEG